MCKANYAVGVNPITPRPVWHLPCKAGRLAYTPVRHQIFDPMGVSVLNLVGHPA